MPLTKQHLQNTYNLTIEDVDATLEAGELSTDRTEYSEQEIQSSFHVIRQYFDQNQVSDYQQAAQLFKQASSPNGRHNKKAKSSLKNSVDKSLSLMELLCYVTQKTGTRFSLADAAKALHLCGLPEKDNYTPDECDRVTSLYEMMLGQSSSVSKKNVSNQISSAAAAAEEGILDLVDVVTEQRSLNLPELVNQAYLKNVVKKLASSQDEIKSFYAGLEAEILEQIEGKSPVRLIIEGRWSEWENMKQLPLSSLRRELPQSESENTTSSD